MVLCMDFSGQKVKIMGVVKERRELKVSGSLELSVSDLPKFFLDPPEGTFRSATEEIRVSAALEDTFHKTLVVPDLKKKMLSKHASQKKWLDESQGLNSYLDSMAELDAEVGRMSCLFKYAEGWRRHLHLGFCAAKDDPLRAALKERVLVAAKYTSG